MMIALVFQNKFQLIGNQQPSRQECTIILSAAKQCRKLMKFIRCITVISLEHLHATEFGSHSQK